MTAVDNNALLTLYGNSLANFGAANAARQETMKSQAGSQVAMQGQLADIQQFCMTVGQQLPSGIYALAQRQCMFNNRHKHNSCGQGSRQGFLQQPTIFLWQAAAFDLSPHILQALGELKLLPHPWR